MDLSKQSSRLWTLAWEGSSYRRCNGGHRDKRIVHSVSSHPQVLHVSLTICCQKYVLRLDFFSKDNFFPNNRERDGSKMVRLMEEDEERQ